MSSVRLDGNESVGVQPLGLSGTCHGHAFYGAGGYSTDKATVESDTCVVREADSLRVYVLFPEELTTFMMKVAC